MLPGGTELPLVWLGRPCAQMVWWVARRARVADAMQRTLVRMPYHAQNKFWHAGREKVLGMLKLSAASCQPCVRSASRMGSQAQAYRHRLSGAGQNASRNEGSQNVG